MQDARIKPVGVPAFTGLIVGISLDYDARMAKRLAGVFPDFTVEVFPERHHFDPPQRVEPARVAALLRSLWSRAEGSPRLVAPRG